MQFDIDMTYANRLPSDPFDEDRTMPIVAAPMDVLPLERVSVNFSKLAGGFQNVILNLDNVLNWQISRVDRKLEKVNKTIVRKLTDVCAAIADWQLTTRIQGQPVNKKIESIEQYDTVADRVLQEIVDGKSKATFGESRTSMAAAPISQSSASNASKQTIIVIFQFNQVTSPSESTSTQHSIALPLLDFFFNTNRPEVAPNGDEWIEREIFDPASEDPYWKHYAELAKNGILFPLKKSSEANHQSVVKINRGERSSVSYSTELPTAENELNTVAIQTWLLMPTKSGIKKFKTLSEYFPAGSRFQLLWININTHIESCWSDNPLFNIWKTTFNFSKERMSLKKPKNKTDQRSSRTPMGTALVPNNMYRAIGASILKLMWIDLDARTFEPSSLIL